MKVLDRQIIIEFCQVLTVGTLSILGIFFGTLEFKNMITLMQQFDVPVPAVMSIWLLQIPTGWAYAMPAGLMISTMFVILRQQRDSELVALQTLGVSRLRFARPFIVLGVICTLLSFGISEYVAPQARHLSTKLLFIEACKSARPCPHLSKIELPDSTNVSQVLILGKTVGHTIEGFLLINLSPQGIVDLTWSRLAERVRGNWQLRNGLLFKVFSNAGNDYRGSFEALTIRSSSKLWERIDGDPLSSLEKTTAQLKKEIEASRSQSKPISGDVIVQYYRRYSQPLSCLLLVLAAIPVMFFANRRDLRAPLAYGAIMVPAYFLLQQIFLSMGENGAINPAVAAWAPALILCLTAASSAACMRARI
jgi:lipopolysaccharide export LptBFGC system permease protein LptF